MRQHNVNLQRPADGVKQQKAKLSQQSNQPALRQIPSQLDNHSIVSRLSQLHSNRMPSMQRTELVAQIAHSHGNNSVQRLIGATANNNVIQRQVVCDPDNPEICWSEDDTFTPASEPNMSYAPTVDTSSGFDQTSPSIPISNPQPSLAERATPPSAQSNWRALDDNPIYKTVTNNAVSGATGLFQAVNLNTINMPNFSNTLTRLGGVRGWNAALKMEDALSLPASKLPGVFGQSGSIVGSRLPMDMSRASAVLAPLGVYSNAMNLEKAIFPATGKPVPSDFERIETGTESALGLFSSSVGTAAFTGAGLNTLGATGAAAAISGGATALAPAAAVAGAGAGGYALGKIMDKAAGGLMNATGASDGIDRLRGISRPEGQHGDYSISGVGAELAVLDDQERTEMLRSIGVLDKSKPAYTQTLGWQLAELLPSWLQ